MLKSLLVSCAVLLTGSASAFAQDWAQFEPAAPDLMGQDEPAAALSVRWRVQPETSRGDIHQSFAFGLSSVRNDRLGGQADLYRWSSSGDGLSSYPDIRFEATEDGGKWYWPASTEGRILAVSLALVAAYGICVLLDNDDNSVGSMEVY